LDTPDSSAAVAPVDADILEVGKMTETANKIRQGAEVYKPRPSYRLVMEFGRNSVSKIVAISQQRAGLDQLEENLRRLDYDFVLLERIEDAPR
jgi:hypothetical protein